MAVPTSLPVAPEGWVSVDDADAGQARLSAHGEFDLAATEALRIPLHEQLAAGRRVVALDMSAVSFVDVVAVDVLADAQRDFRATGATLVITNPSRQVSRLIRLAGLDRKLLATGTGDVTPAPNGRTRSAAR